jgi:hypothetical protein
MNSTGHLPQQNTDAYGKRPPRLLFIGVVTLLAIQFVFIKQIGEPYPALTMPGFDGNGGFQDGRVNVVRYEAVFITDRGEVTIQPQTLLSQFHDSLHWAIAYNCLSPVPATNLKSPAESPRSLLKRIQKRLLPGYRSGSAHRSSPENIATLQDWLRGRANALLPGHRVSRVEIRWFRETVRLEDGNLVVDGSPAGVLLVPLNGDHS